MSNPTATFVGTASATGVSRCGGPSIATPVRTRPLSTELLRGSGNQRQQSTARQRVTMGHTCTASSMGLTIRHRRGEEPNPVRLAHKRFKPMRQRHRCVHSLSCRGRAATNPFRCLMIRRLCRGRAAKPGDERVQLAAKADTEGGVERYALIGRLAGIRIGLAQLARSVIDRPASRRGASSPGHHHFHCPASVRSKSPRRATPRPRAGG